MDQVLELIKFQAAFRLSIVIQPLSIELLLEHQEGNSIIYQRIPLLQIDIDQHNLQRPHILIALLLPHSLTRIRHKRLLCSQVLKIIIT